LENTAPIKIAQENHHHKINIDILFLIIQLIKADSAHPRNTKPFLRLKRDGFLWGRKDAWFYPVIFEVSIDLPVEIIQNENQGQDHLRHDGNENRARDNTGLIP
jgi:hypothetical protein